MQAVITKVEFEPGEPANVLEVDPVKALHWENVRMAWFEKHGMHEQHQAAESWAQHWQGLIYAKG